MSQHLSFMKRIIGLSHLEVEEMRKKMGKINRHSKYRGGKINSNDNRLGAGCGTGPCITRIESEQVIIQGN